jgi:hypothetical protein
MLEMSKTSLHKGIDYCFIYGGANDMYTKSITPKRAVSNIQQIVNLCHKYKIKCIVLTGFDPVKCTRTSNPAYGPKYAQFQKMLMDSISGATVVDTRVIDRTGCWDELWAWDNAWHIGVTAWIYQVTILVFIGGINRRSSAGVKGHGH